MLIPLHVKSDRSLGYGTASPAELAEAAARLGFHLACRMQGIRPMTGLTKRGEPMAFVTLEDEHGLVDAVLPPQALATLADPIENPGPFLVEAHVREANGVLQLAAERLMPFYRREPAGPG